MHRGLQQTMHGVWAAGLRRNPWPLLLLALLLLLCHRVQAADDEAAFLLPGASHITYDAPLRVVEGLPASMGVADVAALPLGRLEVFKPHRRYAASAEAPLWLHLKIVASLAHASRTWLLEFPTVIVDRYQVFQRDAQGSWTVMEAGDRVAHMRWPLDSLRPRFPLLAPAAGEYDVFVRVEHQLPLRLRPVIVEADQAMQRDSDQMLWTGLLLGVIATLVFTCLQMTLAFRDHTYAWYAGYLVCTALAALCYTGIAQRDLWPHATKFSSDAIVYAVVMAFAFNLQFARSMFGGLQGLAWRMAGRVLVALCLGYALLTWARDDYGKHIAGFYGVSLAVFIYLITMAVQAWRRGLVYGGYWLMVYVPYLLSIALSLAASVGMLPSSLLPGQTPVLAAMAEAVAMMWCINAYGRLRHAQAVREQVAARRDPLTGFLQLRVFRKRAGLIWDSAARNHRDVAVIYVSVEPAQSSTQNAVEAEALVARSVRQVRTVTREFDTVGRLARNRLGIVMTDLAPGDALSSRLARLVALGLMVDPQDPSAMEIRFRLVVGARRDFGGNFVELDSALTAMLDRHDGSPRAIQFLSDVIPVQRVGARPSSV